MKARSLIQTYLLLIVLPTKRSTQHTATVLNILHCGAAKFLTPHQIHQGVSTRVHCEQHKVEHHVYVVFGGHAVVEEVRGG